MRNTKNIFPGMGKDGLLMFFVITAFIFFLPPAHSYSSILDSLYIRHIDGDVQIKTEDTEDWVPAAINMPLSEGGRVWGPDAARVELQLKDGTYLRMNENSSLDILTLDKNSFQFYLGTGQAFVNFMGLKGSVLQIDTPVSSVVAYDKAYFRIDLSANGQMQVSVFKGIVYAENKNDRIKVDSKNTLTLRDNRTELAGLGPVDDWERWNRDRDAKFVEHKGPSKYLPEELGSYSNDFEKNGRWVASSDYGHVWTPNVIVSANWSPYTVGRWTWIGGDYVWISYEPWGWAPYHYGRWVFVPSVGWGWVPPPRGAVFWSPGFVGWVQTPTYVAWVPLAPGDIYYGYGNYGPGSVNITNINIRKTIVKKTVYKNVRVKNAVTVVNRDTFVRGKDGKTKTKVRENPFLREKVNIGRPEIKPEKETYMPVVKDIPQAKHPPKQIRETNIKELKTRKPLVREKTVPVMKPESREKEPTPKKHVKPSEKQEKPTGETIKKEEEVKMPGKKPEKTKKAKDSGLTPLEKQRLKQKFEKQQGAGPEIERQPEKINRPAVETPAETALPGLLPSERQKLKKKPEKQKRPGTGTIERQQRETKGPGVELQKEAVPKKSEDRKPTKKEHTKTGEPEKGKKGD